jgi:NAD(P)-dependent dehydrogenase (short-subunit alcohol dehydrogenase family)
VSTNVVIGAGSGMGAAAAALLAPKGRLVLADRDTEAAARVAETLVGDVEVVACDITDDEAVDALVAVTGQLGGLVHTAGLSPTMADGRRIVEVNLLGTDRVLRAFEPSLGPGSAAVCFASMAAHVVPADPAVDAILDEPGATDMLDRLAALGLLDHPGLAYAVSKRGVIRLVQRRSAVWGAQGARVLSLSPGIIDTPMGRLEDASEPAMAAAVAASPLRREGRAAEVAAVAAFLVSEEASFMTGTDVLVDGGVVASNAIGGGAG